MTAVDAIAGACPRGPLSGQDLVHGNFNLANTIAARGRLWVVDVEALGAGPRAYDLAEALLVGAGHGQLTESAAARCGPTPPGWTAGTSRSAPARSA